MALLRGKLFAGALFVGALFGAVHAHDVGATGQDKSDKAAARPKHEYPNYQQWLADTEAARQRYATAPPQVEATTEREPTPQEHITQVHAKALPRVQTQPKRYARIVFPQQQETTRKDLIANEIGRKQSTDKAIVAAPDESVLIMAALIAMDEI